MEAKEEFGILFVDDEDMALKYFTKAFKNDYTIHTATSVDEAKSILDERASSIGVLITDQRMPDKKGVDLLKHVRKEQPQITRMLTTAYSDLDDAIEAVNSGEIMRYVTKPWDLKALGMELRHAMSFFKLKRERDFLMQEKLSALQRMQGLNRLRDLITMASAITVTNNAPQAIKALAEQLPNAATSESSGTRDFSGSVDLQKEIETVVAMASAAIGAIQSQASSSESTACSISQLVEEAAQANGQANLVTLEASQASGEINANRPLAQLMFASIIQWAVERSENPGVQILVEDQADASSATFKIPGGSWGDVSLLNIPSPLLVAFLACYHHGGSIALSEDADFGFRIELSLPKDSALAAPSQTDLAWFQRSVSRFQNW